MRLPITLGALSAANLGVVLFIQWYTLVAIGPGPETDALFAGAALPQFILAVASQSLMHVLVPLLASDNEEGRHQSSWAFLIAIGSLFGVIAALLALTAQFWVPILFPGFDPVVSLLAVSLVRIQVIGMVFSALSGVLLAVYHANQQFIWAETTPLIGSIFAVGILIWGLPRYGIVVAAIANVLRMGIQVIILLPGMGPFRRPDWNSSVWKTAWGRLKPLLLGSSYYKMDPLVDRALSSMAISGSLSLLYLAQQLFSVAVHIVNSAIATPLVPKLAVLAAHDQHRDFRNAYRRRLLLLLILSAIGMSYLVFLGQSSLSLLIGYGAITDENVQVLWFTMLALAGVPVGGALGQILSTTFYAMGNTTTPTKVGVIGYTLGIFLKISGFAVLGITGLALGTSIYYLANALTLYILIERQMTQHVSITNTT